MPRLSKIKKDDPEDEEIKVGKKRGRKPTAKTLKATKETETKKTTRKRGKEEKDENDEHEEHEDDNNDNELENEVDNEKSNKDAENADADADDENNTDDADNDAANDNDMENDIKEKDDADTEDMDEQNDDNKSKPSKKDTVEKQKPTKGRKGQSDESSRQTEHENTNVNTRASIKMVRVSRPVANMHEQSASSNTAPGKTYKRPYDNRSHANNRSNRLDETNEAKQTTVLRFDYQEIIDIAGERKLNECDLNTTLKYWIAMKHQEGLPSRAICSVLKNTLTGCNGETNLPILTLGNGGKRRNYQPRRTNTINHFKGNHQP